MHNTLERNRRLSRDGFTLVELLVGVGIFVILATISLGAFNAATEGDRGAAAASAFRAWIQGAKSRAAKLGRPVGVRPIVSSNVTDLNGHIVDQFEYVANVEPISGNLEFSTTVPTTSRRLPTTGGVEFTVGGFVHKGLFFDRAPGVNRWLVQQSSTALPQWSNLDGLDAGGDVDSDEPRLIYPGLRIKIPNTPSGQWFRISSIDPRTLGSLMNAGRFNPSFIDGGGLQLNGFYIEGEPSRARTTVNVSGVSGAAVTRPPAALNDADAWDFTKVVDFDTSELTYLVELGPDILEDERTLSMPGGMALDLDASTTPAGFAPASAADPYGAFALMFSPSGEVIGDYANAGILSFYIDKRDALTAFAGAVNLAETPWDETTHIRQSWGEIALPRMIPAESFGDPRVLTVFPKSGVVQSSVVDPTDTVTVDGTGTVTATGTPDGWADSPYGFQLNGEFDQ